MASRLVDALSNIDSDLGPGRGYTYTIVAIQDHQRSTPAQVLLCTPIQPWSLWSENLKFDEAFIGEP